MEKKKFLLNEDDLSKVMGGVNSDALRLQILKKEDAMKAKDAYTLGRWLHGNGAWSMQGKAAARAKAAETFADKVTDFKAED